MKQRYFTDAPPTSVLHAPCHKCGAMSGNPCRDRKGQVRLPVHTVRARAFEKWQVQKNQEAA